MRRDPGGSALVVLLIALPIMALTFGLALFESHQASPDQIADYSLGHFDARITAVAPPGTAIEQSSTDDSQYATLDEYSPTADAAARPELPAGLDVVEIGPAMSVPVKTAGGSSSLRLITGEAWDSRFAGAFDVVEGRAPRTAQEVAVTAATLTRLDAGIGDQIRPIDEALSPVVITGVIASLQLRPEDQVIFVPTASPLIEAGDTTEATPVASAYSDPVPIRWYVDDWTPTPSDLAALNASGYTLLARSLLDHAPKLPDFDQRDATRTQTYLMGAGGGALVCVLVGLMAGAAIAVSTRRQQRTLAMIAGVGASRADVFGIVVGQAVVLGVVAAAVGIGTGAGLAAIVLPLTAGEGNDLTWRYWGFALPPTPIAIIAALAVIVAVAAALVPARAATRGDTIAALRGARRPPHLSARLPIWGLLVAVLGIGAAASAVTLLAMRRGRDLIPSNLLLAFGLVMLAVLTGLIGLALCGHWLFLTLARLTSRTGVATRLAMRDASASPSRTVPAFLAIAAAILVGTVALSVTALGAAAADRAYGWTAPAGSLYIQTVTDRGTPESRADSARILQELAADVPHTAIAMIAHTATVQYDWEGSGGPIDPTQLVGGTGWYDPECDAAGCTDGWAMTTSPPAVISTDDLPTAVGVVLTADQRTAYEQGAAIVRSEAQTQDGHTRVFAVSAAAIYERDPGITPTDLAASTRVPAIVLPHAPTTESLIIAPATAARLGLGVEVTAAVVVPRATWTDAMTDRLTEDIAGSLGAEQAIGVYRVRGPEPGAPWMAIFSLIAGVVVLGAAAVTLGLARFERRGDDATLVAVGGRTVIRRRINAVQALFVVGVGCASGAALGIIPAIALVMSESAFLLRDIPLLWIGMLVIGLPILMAAAAWLVPPRRVELTHRSAVT
ncbi:FtsX-like permease family protein [Microbacterium gorillae]|uniref:FtsX-like permease family protein n=1 Tax=Microbacterium gorillae TaxID=1231063 RepID=UPI003D979E03